MAWRERIKKAEAESYINDMTPERKEKFFQFLEKHKIEGNRVSYYRIYNSIEAEVNKYGSKLDSFSIYFQQWHGQD